MSIKTIVAAGLLVAGMGFAAHAQAATGPGFDKNMVQEAAYGCGPGFTRGPAGHCRPMFTCPPGWHSGPYGYHCFPNRHPRWHAWHPHRWHAHRWHRW